LALSRAPVALSDAQLRMVMVAARPLEPEKRSLLLQRIAGKLDLSGPMFTDPMSRRRSDPGWRG